MDSVDPKEILGFDPQTGNRTEDKSNFQTLPAQGKGYSEETKQKFAASVENFKSSARMYSEFRTEPDQLFMAARNQQSGLFERVYYKQPGDRRYASLEIQRPTNEKSEYIRIFLQGEQQPGWNDEKDETEIQVAKDGLTAVNSEFGKRTLYAIFDRVGGINSLTLGDFSEHDLHALNGPTHGIDLRQVMMDGSGKFTSGNVSYFMEYDDKEKEFHLTRKKNGILEDDVKFPAVINRDEIVKKLLPGALVDDPYDTGNEFDDEWKIANLATFGITWERHDDSTKIPPPAEEV